MSGRGRFDRRIDTKLPRLLRLATPVGVALTIDELRRARTAPDTVRLDAAMGWLVRAQVAGQGGISSGYDLADGWLAPYPETTGYIIGSLLHHGILCGNRSSTQTADALGEWLVGQQRADGSFSPGPHMSSMAKSGEARFVFDTGQILLGLVALADVTGQDRYARAASRAASWLTEIQDDSGSWTSEPGATTHTYDSRVAWGVARAGAVLDEPRWTQCAAKAMRWICAQQERNGWIRHMSFQAGDPPLTHTIGYTIEGLLEWSLATGQVDSQAWQVAVTALEAIKAAYDKVGSGARLRRSGRLAGTLRPDWTSQDRWSCVTGSLQLGLCLRRINKGTNRPDLAEFGDCLIDSAAASQTLVRSTRETIGGIPGSSPVWGSYGSFRYINWGVKFLVDAMLDRKAPGLPVVRFS